MYQDKRLECLNEIYIVRFQMKHVQGVNQTNSVFDMGHHSYIHIPYFPIKKIEVGLYEINSCLTYARYLNMQLFHICISAKFNALEVSTQKGTINRIIKTIESMNSKHKQETNQWMYGPGTILTSLQPNMLEGLIRIINQYLILILGSRYCRYMKWHFRLCPHCLFVPRGHLHQLRRYNIKEARKRDLQYKALYIYIYI